MNNVIVGGMFHFKLTTIKFGVFSVLSILKLNRVRCVERDCGVLSIVGFSFLFVVVFFFLTKLILVHFNYWVNKD